MQIIEDAAVHEQYCRVITPEPAISEESEDVCALLKQCLDMRWEDSLLPALRICIVLHARLQYWLAGADPFHSCQWLLGTCVKRNGMK